jgi:cytochrome c-type biogenesis protein CcmE
MAELSWEKASQQLAKSNATDRYKFVIGGVLLLAAVVYLIVSGTSTGARYFITVDDLMGNNEYVGQTVRISGAVIGDTIVYDSRNLIIDFTIANIPEDTTDLAQTLHLAVTDETATRIPVHIENQVMPDLLKHEAQAILTGTLGADGIFYATELLLKCPSRYEESVPSQADSPA